MDDQVVLRNAMARCIGWCEAKVLLFIKKYVTNGLKELLAEFVDSDVYHVNKMGFYKLLPKRTLSSKNERRCGGKLSKESVTVLVGANTDGSDKVQLLVASKSKTSQCFKNSPSIPAGYETNSRAWK